jgi:hypothetical protein
MHELVSQSVSQLLVKLTEEYIKQKEMLIL